MGFKLRKKNAETKKRKRKRKQQNDTEAENPFLVKTTPDFKQMISIKDKLPPDTKEEILVWKQWGFDIGISFIELQHINHDIQTLGYARTTHWFPLSKM
jgi:hypothetical protein